MTNRRNVQNTENNLYGTDICVIAYNNGGRPKYLGYNDEGVFETLSLRPWDSDAELHAVIIFTSEWQAMKFLENCKEMVKNNNIKIEHINEYKILPLMINFA